MFPAVSSPTGICMDYIDHVPGTRYLVQRSFFQPWSCKYDGTPIGTPIGAECGLLAWDVARLQAVVYTVGYSSCSLGVSLIRRDEQLAVFRYSFKARSEKVHAKHVYTYEYEPSVVVVVDTWCHISSLHH